MVRGRRVRAVVTCTTTDDCCSPNAKRKDTIGKLSHTLSPSVKTQSIAKFFQVANAARENNTNTTLNEIIEAKHKDNISEKCLESEISSVLNSILSPPTPHRIELCFDETATNNINNNNIVQTERLALTPKRFPAPKSRKKLNVNQTANQLSKLQQSAPTLPTIATVKKPSSNNHAITEFFPVRRSVRKTKKTVLEEKQRTIEDLIRNNIEEGLKVENFEMKGRGVIADRSFAKGDFVVEYSGELIDLTEARDREVKYAQDQNTGCYMYYFKYKSQQYCIDATSETGRLGRLVNHSRNGNLTTRIVSVDGRPRLVLVARDDLRAGDEVTYDYGDRSKESLAHHPWLAY